MSRKSAIGINEIDRESMMHQQEQCFSAEPCDELAQALLQEAAGMPCGHRNERLKAYGTLGQMKRMFLRGSN